MLDGIKRSIRFSIASSSPSRNNEKNFKSGTKTFLNHIVSSYQIVTIEKGSFWCSVCQVFYLYLRKISSTCNMSSVYLATQPHKSRHWKQFPAEFLCARSNCLSGLLFADCCCFLLNYISIRRHWTIL